MTQTESRQTGSQIRPYRPGDREAAYWICLKTGDHGADGEALYREDPDALARIYVGPYLEFEPEFSLLLEDAEGVCGYCLGARDTQAFFRRYEQEWRPRLCEQFPEPTGDAANWTPAQQVHHLYHHPDYFHPEPHADYPAHAHIDLLERAQGRGFGRRLMEQMSRMLAAAGSPGGHLGVSERNERALGFYRKLGFAELARDGGAVYLGKKLNRPS